MTQSIQTHVVIVGSGLAGMVAALQLAPIPVFLITQGKLGKQTSSILAQGGIASAYYEQDHYASHIQDTIRAGAGLSDPQIVRDILSMGREAIDLLKDYQVVFDQDEQGKTILGLEAAHTHHRIFHIHGDATGKHIVHKLCQAVQSAPHITVMEETFAKQLLTDDNQITGIIVQQKNRSITIQTPNVIMATGGIGGLYENSTNPLGNYGQGLTIAANAGAILSDLEFVQFHPTALDHPSYPKILISEAVRGEGAILLNEKNERFLEHIDGTELAPRNVVASAIFQEIQRGGKVFLDARTSIGNQFKSRFPTIDYLCKSVGINPEHDLIPVQPVEHFHMGGIAADSNGKTSILGLWAIGECASTGLHGANRLASNSLLEATIMAIRVTRSILALPIESKFTQPSYKEWNVSNDTGSVQSVMQSCVGILRNENSLKKAIQYLFPLVSNTDVKHYPAQIALMITISALLRQESRGAHVREDYPQLSESSQRSFMTYNQAIQIAEQSI